MRRNPLVNFLFFKTVIMLTNGYWTGIETLAYEWWAHKAE
jgi:hypothetical protein